MQDGSSLVGSIVQFQASPHNNGIQDRILTRQLRTKHKSRNSDKLTETTEEILKIFTVLQWPPQLPDLNPIEHFWHVLQRE